MSKDSPVAPYLLEDNSKNNPLKDFKEREKTIGG
jgi:hypothetical protein